MTIYYVQNFTPQVGYIVTRLEQEDGFISTRNICCFGYSQPDAIRFCDDINAGKISPARIERLMDNYTDQPYKYCGKGILKKQKD